MKRRELPVLFYDLTVKARFRNMEVEPVPPDAMTLIGLCAPMRSPPWHEGAVRRSIEDWRRYPNGQHAILINRADQDSTDVALVNFPSGVRRQAGKTAEDGIEYSCHVLIIPPTAARINPLVLATGGSGMSREQLERAINGFLRMASKLPENSAIFERPHPNGESKKTLTLQCRFELLAHQSRLFSDILRQGRLHEVELIQHDHTAVDRHFLQKAHSIQLIVAEEGSPLSIQLLKRAIGAANINPDQLVVKFRDPDTGSNTTKTLAMNDLERALTKRDLIRFQTDISPCYTRINPDIVGKLRELL